MFVVSDSTGKIVRKLLRRSNLVIILSYKNAKALEILSHSVVNRKKNNNKITP